MKPNPFRPKIWAAVNLAVVLSLMHGSAALGCTCFPWAHPVQAASSASFVFAGRVTAITVVEEWVVEVRIDVSDVYKGELGAEALVYTSTEGSLCGYGFELQSEYLIYANGPQDRISVNHCQRTQLLDRAQGDILVLNAGRAPAPTTDQLFFTLASGKAIYRVCVDGCNLTELIKLEGGLGPEAFASHGISVSADGLAWSGRDGIFVAGVDGSTPGRLSDTTQFGQPLGLSFTSYGIFCTVQSQPDIFAIQPGTADPIVQGAGRPLGITASGPKTIWTDPSQDAIYTSDVWPLPSHHTKLIDLNAIFGPADHNPTGITTANSRLFWADRAQDAIYTAELDGSNPTLLVDLKSQLGDADYDPKGIAVSSSQLFWTDSGPDTSAIYTANLDGSNARKLLDSSSLGKPQWLAYLPGRPLTNTPRLRIRSIRRDSPSVLTLAWDSEEGIDYRIESSRDLKCWEKVIVVRGAAGSSTSYSHEQAFSSEAYYRLVQLANESE